MSGWNRFNNFVDRWNFIELCVVLLGFVLVGAYALGNQTSGGF